jgi:alpha-tubulin suppressor-like RCC1 family protein
MCLQAAAGNVNSTFLCLDDNDRTFVVSSGITLVAAEGHSEIERNELYEKDMDKVEQVSSLPFMIEFAHPVTKVMCGSLFAGLLTCDGRVFTWGDN